MSPKTLKLVGTVYLVKSILILTAWMIVPDLPHRAAEAIRTTWARVKP